MNRINQTRYTLIIRWTFFFVGLMILGFGISLTMQAKDLGIGPWDVLHYGLFLQFGLSVGTWSIIAGIIVVTATALILKKRPQIGTVLNMVLIGIFIDLFNWLLPEPNMLWLEVIVFVGGVAVIALGIGIYVAPGIGAGPRDGLMLVITEKTGWKVSAVRNGIEISVALIGWLLGGPIGFGTIFIAFFFGSFLGYALPYTKQLLHFIIRKGDTYEDIYQGTLRPDHHDRIS
ncbi:YitT family protein [Thalassobacillus sp. CUG 92003]|uniref:YczE/YyaS/YitT family protein n=1 Tax=Thalassobacillus sp. CUG 92003 TaxID=2736641 RepID=UPI0015E6FE87|nr:YitT family protein [Thalassobacillus sp. CUG 92003]